MSNLLALDKRARQAAALKTILRSQMTQRLSSQLLPWDGRWLAAEDIEREQQRAARRAWTTLGELLLLFVIIDLVAYVLYTLTRSLAY